MIPNNEFYSAFLNNHFKIKSRIAAYFLNLSAIELIELNNYTHLNINDIEFSKTIKIDLVQTFYQSIESLFGLMYSLEDIDSGLDLPDYLVNSNIGNSHKFINSFKDFEYCNQYPISLIKDKAGREIPKYQWLFYFATLFIDDVPKEFLSKIHDENNIKGIAYTLNSLAQLFNSEAHNSIKHGLRCIIINKLNISFNLPEGHHISNEFRNFGGTEDILMYYTKNQKKNGPAATVFVPVDVKYIIYLEDGNSKLLFNLINLRQIVFGKDKPEEVKAHFFSYKELIKTQFPAFSDFESIRMDPIV